MIQCLNLKTLFSLRAPFFLGVLSYLLLVTGNAQAAPSCSSLGITVTRVSSPVLYIDLGITPNLTNDYAGYQITNGSGSAISDLWVKIGSFSGTTIKLATLDPGVHHSGPLANAGVDYAYFYLKATAQIGTAQTHKITLYSGNPNSTAATCEESFSLTSADVIKANANKVEAVLATPNPPELGGTAIMSVKGATGTIGAAGIFAYTPATLDNWPADVFELYDTKMVMTGGNNRTDNKLLYLSGLNSSTTNYTVTYKFRLRSLNNLNVDVYPANFISSGTQIKHTDVAGFSASLGPILPAVGHVFIESMNVVPNLLPTGGSAQYQITFRNDGSSDIAFDDIVVTLPSSPDLPTFDGGVTPTYGGVNTVTPSISGQVLTFSSTFSVPAGDTKTLLFSVNVPNTSGVYQTSAVGHIGVLGGSTVQIDSTSSISDDVPAQATYGVGNLLGSIGGSVWDDYNNDGSFQVTESGIGGVTLTLYQDDGDSVFEPGADDAAVGSTSTSSTGTYTFAVSGAGSYWVKITDVQGLLAGSTQTGGAAQPELVSVANGGTVSNANYGYNLPPTITVKLTYTNDSTPPLTGLVDDPNAVVQVTVNGNTYPATNNGDGTWTLANNTISPALASATYSVTATATDAFGNTGTDTTSNELTVDAPAPNNPTVNFLTTTDNTPSITGTYDSTNSDSFFVTVNGVTYTKGFSTELSTSGSNWTLAIASSMPDGTYDVLATSFNANGDRADDLTINELRIDTSAPSITITPKSTNDNTPSLSGTVDDPTATIQVTVNGNTYVATNNGDGTWTLNDNIIAPLPDATYSVIATATDTFGNVGTDPTVNELTIDTTAPGTPTVVSQTTSNNQPTIVGTFDEAGSTVFRVTVNGTTYQLGVDPELTSNGSGNWTLNLGSRPPMNDGVYNVTATASDSFGNSSTDLTSGELTIDAVSPTITVDVLFTNDSTPALTGTIDDNTATISITVNGNSYPAVNNGDGTWTLPNDTIAPPLSSGVYDVAAQATDPSLHVGNDATTNELTIDVTAPTVTVNTKTTNDSTPSLSGTVDDPLATVRVTVDGTTYTAVNNGDGTWTLADNTITPALADGVYEVAATATDLAGNVGNDATSNELTIDTIAPIITVNTKTTNDSTPSLSGTVDDPTATIDILVNGNHYAATNNGDGTWTLNDNTIAPALAEGLYEVVATATDAAGNDGTDATNNELLIDLTAPTVTVNSRTTNDTTPQLTGTVNDSTATVRVTVNGNTYTATNNGDGTWTLADNTISPALAEAVYEVAVTATDPAGNVGSDATSNELTIDLTAPTVTVNSRVTNDTTPQLTGTVNDPTAVVQITVNGNPYTATNNGNGTWTLADNTISPALAAGIYEVAATATDTAGNVGNDGTSNELTIDLTAPIVTVNLLTTSDTTPQLTGTVNDPTAVVRITVNGNTYTATNNGNGTWTLADNTISPALADGVYNVAAAATDSAGNVGNDATVNELTIDHTPPTVTITPASTTDTTPPLSGTVNDPTAVVRVTVDGHTYTAVNNGDGTWTLPDNTINPPLSVGGYEIVVTATDSNGNVGSDSSVNELQILSSDPDGELSSPVFVKWNTYLKQWNFLELTDQGTQSLDVTVTLYNLFGEQMIQVSTTIAAGGENDLDVNDLIKQACTTVNPTSCSQFADIDGNGLIDSYGLAKLTFVTGNPNARLRGRLSNYRPDDAASTFSFAFERPLVNSSRGTTFGASNTFDAQGLGNLVPNWAEVISLAPGLNGFTVKLYNQAGTMIQSQHIALQMLEERDIQAGHEIVDPASGQVIESVYQVEVTPDDPSVDYLFSVARYSSNAAGSSVASSYNYAFALPGRPGADGEVFGFISNENLSCGSVTNWVEVMNVTNSTIQETVTFYDSNGAFVASSTDSLAPHAQYHYNASALLAAGATGTVKVSSNVSGAIVGEVLLYIHECDRNSLQTAYMTRLYRPGRAAQSGSANSFIGMDDELRVGIAVGTPTAVQWAISTFSGESSNGTLNIPGFGSTRLALTGNQAVNFPSDRYGLVTANSPTLGQYIAEVVRIRKITSQGQIRFDYVMPTLVR